jgi:hypothetical protein
MAMDVVRENRDETEVSGPGTAWQIRASDLDFADKPRNQPFFIRLFLTPYGSLFLSRSQNHRNS